MKVKTPFIWNNLNLFSASQEIFCMFVGDSGQNWGYIIHEVLFRFGFGVTGRRCDCGHRTFRAEAGCPGLGKGSACTELGCALCPGQLCSEPLLGRWPEGL